MLNVFKTTVCPLPEGVKEIIEHVQTLELTLERDRFSTG